MDALKKERSGKWQLKYTIENIPAEDFWNKIKERYGGTMFELSEFGRIVEFE